MKKTFEKALANFHRQQVIRPPRFLLFYNSLNNIWVSFGYFYHNCFSRESTRRVLCLKYDSRQQSVERSQQVLRTPKLFHNFEDLIGPQIKCKKIFIEIFIEPQWTFRTQDPGANLEESRRSMKEFFATLVDG